MRVFSRNHLCLVLCAMSFTGATALADDRREPPRGGPGDGAQGAPRKPPEAAFSACTNLKEDDVCEVEMGQRTIEGKCVPAREEERLVCMPDRPPAPPEARSACRDKAAGDTCTVTTPDGDTLPDGTCAEGPRGGDLHCRPARPPAP
jgi:hypothetical protein